jgi:flagellar motor switch protein FliG
MTQPQPERRAKSAPEPEKLTGPKKVAALLLSMDRHVATRLLKHFDEDDIKLIAQTATDLGSVTKTTLDELIEEFAQSLRTGGDLLATADEVEALLSGVVPPEQIA